MRLNFIRKSWPLLVLLSIFLIGAWAATNQRFFNGVTEKNISDTPQDDVKDNSLNLNAPRIATGTSSYWYYDDTVTEANLRLGNTQWLSVRYNLGATSIVTGIRYWHTDVGAGPYDFDIRFVGDTTNVVYPATVGYSSGSWQTYSCLGPTYLIDDDPWIQLESDNLDQTTNYMRIGGDDPNAGHTYFSTNQGTTWSLSGSYEYLIDIRYETIPTLNPGARVSGTFGSGDYVDAYYVTLNAGTNYRFFMTRTSGTENVNFRLANYVSGGVTGSTVAIDAGDHHPKLMNYATGATTTYLLLVYPGTTVSTAQYALSYMAVTTDDGYEPNNNMTLSAGISTPFDSSTLRAQDDDWYYFSVPAGYTINAYLGFTDSIEDLDLYLYDYLGNQLAYSASANNNWELVTYNVLNPGNYYLQARLWNGTSNNYRMMVNLTLWDDIYEDNDARGQAALITTGNHYNLVALDDDWFNISVPERFTITANISFNHLIGDVDLRLYNRTGDLVSSSLSSSNDWELVSYAVTLTGNVSIRVNLASGTWTYYSITVTILPTEDAFEPNDVAGSASLVYFGNYYWLAPLDDDWYRISVPEDYTLVVDISFINAIGDLDLYLYNSYNFVTPINSSTSGSNNWERVSYRTFSTDFYYIKVVLSSGTPTHYDLTLSTRVDVYDADEPNNDFAQAHKVYSSDYPETSLVIQDIADYYYFSVEAGSYITVNISFYHVIADLDLYLYNTAQTQVNSSTSASNDWERVTYLAGVTGNYYIRVYRYSSNQALYDLSVKVTAPDDGYENNDDKAQATPIGIGTYISLVCEDDDYYYLYIPAGYTFIANITFNHLVTSLDLTITNATSEFPWLNWTYSFDDTNRISYTVSEAGFYYLKVSGFGSPVHYSMTIFVTIQDDAYEENDVRAQARAISTGDHNWLVAEDDDWYSLNVDAGSEVHVYLWFNNSIGNLDLFLYNPAGSQVNSSTSTIFDFEYVFYNVTAAGNYYIRTTLTSGLPTFYNLTIITISWDDFYEPNDVQSQSTVVSFGSLNFLRCIDDDWFNMTAPAGILLKVNITFDHLVGNLNLYLYNASGIQLNQSISASNDWEEVTFAIRVSGYYLIKVVWASGSWAEYNLTIWPVLPNGDDVFETNNIKADAAEVSINSTYETLVCANDDWYKIYVEAGNTVSCSIYFDNNFGDLDLKIFDASGALLGLSQGNYDFEVVAANVTHSAYYFIQVYKFNPLGSNSYQMLLMTMELPLEAMDDTYEENDFKLQAAELVPGTFTGLVCADDDWFKVYVTAGNMLSVSISFTNSLGNLDLGLFNAAGSLNSSTSTTSNGESLTFDITTTGYYYIRVYRITTTNEYSLTITPTTIVSKPLPPPPAEIPGYDLFIMASSCFIAIALITVKKINRRRN